MAGAVILSALVTGEPDAADKRAAPLCLCYAALAVNLPAHDTVVAVRTTINLV